MTQDVSDAGVPKWDTRRLRWWWFRSRNLVEDARGIFQSLRSCAWNLRNIGKKGRKFTHNLILRHVRIFVPWSVLEWSYHIIHCGHPFNSGHPAVTVQHLKQNTFFSFEHNHLFSLLKPSYRFRSMTTIIGLPVPIAQGKYTCIIFYFTMKIFIGNHDGRHRPKLVPMFKLKKK